MLPDLFLNNKLYKGPAAYINGYNGYTSSSNDGALCALIDNSCFVKGTSEGNLLRTATGGLVVNTALRGVQITI